MSEHPFQRFINLIQFDQQICALETEISKINQGVAEIDDQEAKLFSELEAIKMNVNQLRKKVDVLEREMKELDQQEKEKKLLAENITNYKEYQSIKSEIESIQKYQLDHEQAILDGWNKLESAQASAEKKNKEINDQLLQNRLTRQERIEKKLLLEEQLKILIDQRSEKEKDIPQEWLEKYSSMRAQVSNPVVPIEHESCTACFQQITNQEMIRAKRGALLQCKRCFRFLFIPEIISVTEKA